MNFQQFLLEYLFLIGQMQYSIKLLYNDNNMLSQAHYRCQLNELNINLNWIFTSIYYFISLVW